MLRAYRELKFANIASVLNFHAYIYCFGISKHLRDMLHDFLFVIINQPRIKYGVVQTSLNIN